MNPDTFWMNLRYSLIFVGGGLVFSHLKGFMTEEQAKELVTPIVDLGLGVVAAVGAALWGNIVKWGTKTVSRFTGARPDVPTVSAATGATEK
jgi:hypothetical protein